MSFDYSKLATLRPKQVEQEKDNRAITGVTAPVITPVKAPAETPVTSPVTPPAETPVITAVTTPVITPAETPVIAPVTTQVPSGVAGPEGPVSLEYLDATHTGSEQKVYSVMYRQGRERHWGFQELARLTGIRSDQTIRRAIDGLIAKLSIEIISYRHGSPVGPRYQIFTPKEIQQRRRRAGMEIDRQTKKILTPVITGVTTGVITPVVTGGKNHGSTPVKITGVSLNSLKSDDDIAPLFAALRFLAPSDTEEGTRIAERDIVGLVVAELEAASARARDVPASAQFGVECIRRAMRRGDASKRVAKPDSAPAAGQSADVPSEGSVYDIRTIAARLLEAHRGEPDFGHERLYTLVCEALIGQGKDADDTSIRVAIKGMAP